MKIWSTRAGEKLPPWLLAIRIPLLIAIHLAVFSVAYLLAFALRFDLEIPAAYASVMWKTLPVAVVLQTALFIGFHTLHGWWRYVTFRDLATFIKPLAVSLACFLSLNALQDQLRVPQSVLLMHILLSGFLLSIVRSSWRIGHDLSTGALLREPSHKPRTQAFLISNHHDTLILANQINCQPNSVTKIVGLLAYTNYRRGSTRAGIPIVGHPSEAAQLAAKYAATEVWLVAGSLPGQELIELKRTYDQVGLQTKVIPAAVDRNHNSSFIPVREIEIKDLLTRDSVVLDDQSISAELSGKTILVTGAGGSIGSEICRQLMRFNPQRLVLVDHRENSVFLIHNELSYAYESQRDCLVPAVADILDVERMTHLFAEYQPDFVYHATAHKHVGLMEVSPGEAIKNNILGTKRVADLADRFGATKFVLVSTDKAVNPTSIMGCTKQIAERYVLTMGDHSPTRYVVVRFGNVLGSNGSVVPLFKEQIARGGPITITDPRMTRFFMTIPEASQLVLQAANLGRGGEIFVLDMGEQVRIVDLAKKMIELAGLPEDSIEIKFTGARPGEKLYEELYFDEEQTLPTQHKKIFAASHRMLDQEEVAGCINRLLSSADQPKAHISQLFKEYIPEYHSTFATPEPHTADVAKSTAQPEPLTARS